MTQIMELMDKRAKAWEAAKAFLNSLLPEKSSGSQPGSSNDFEPGSMRRQFI